MALKDKQPGSKRRSRHLRYARRFGDGCWLCCPNNARAEASRLACRKRSAFANERAAY